MNATQLCMLAASMLALAGCGSGGRDGGTRAATRTGAITTPASGVKLSGKLPPGAADRLDTAEEATKQARVYLREIVPKFNLLAYYRFGAPIARAIMHFLYRPVVERKPLRDFNDRMPRGPQPR